MGASSTARLKSSSAFLGSPLLRTAAPRRVYADACTGFREMAWEASEIAARKLLSSRYAAPRSTHASGLDGRSSIALVKLGSAISGLASPTYDLPRII